MNDAHLKEAAKLFDRAEPAPTATKRNGGPSTERQAREALPDRRNERPGGITRPPLFHRPIFCGSVRHGVIDRFCFLKRIE
jgi:hypothetical protein